MIFRVNINDTFGLIHGFISNTKFILINQLLMYYLYSVSSNGPIKSVDQQLYLDRIRSKYNLVINI